MTILLAIFALATIIAIFLIEGLGVGLSTVEREERE